MLKCYKTEEGLLRELPLTKSSPGCWFELEKPTNDELNTICQITNVTIDLLKAALDDEEPARLEFEENSFLIVIKTPLMEDEDSFITMPLGIVLTQDYFITICLNNNLIMSNFKNKKTAPFNTAKKTMFIFQVIEEISKLYLRYLRYINAQTDKLELKLRKTMKNKILYQLLDFEKSLVYFTTALKDNDRVIRKLIRYRTNNFPLFKSYEEDEDLVEDVVVENQQAIEMVEMYSNILSSMMDAFASIISNNLNVVMKILTSMTILLAIPTMISSFWGMNVGVPWKDSVEGFYFVAIIAIIATFSAFIILLRREMF